MSWKKHNTPDEIFPIDAGSHRETLKAIMTFSNEIGDKIQVVDGKDTYGFYRGPVYDVFEMVNYIPKEVVGMIDI